MKGMMMMKKMVAGWILVAMSGVYAADMDQQTGKIKNQVVNVSKGDAEMNAAISQARATLDDFLALSARQPKGAENFKLKVGFTDPANTTNTEYMWVMTFQQTGGKFQGILTGNPKYVENVENGDTVHFSRADIVDWGYSIQGKQKGSYTVCVMFKHMSAKEVKMYREDHGFECY